MTRNWRRWMMVAALVLPALVVLAGQISDISGVSGSTFDIGIGASKCTLTNAAGALSLSGGLTVTGTVDLSGATSSATKVTNLNADQTDGMSLVGNANGGVVYQSSGSALSATGAGTSGQFLLSGGSGAPTWAGLASASIFVGNGSNIPTAVAMSGDATMSNAGVLTLASNSVATAEITNASVTAGKLDSTLEDSLPTCTIALAAESSDEIVVTVQLKDANANNLSQLANVIVTISDSATSLAPASVGADSVVWTTGALAAEVVGDKCFLAGTNSSGALVFGVTYLALSKTVYVHVSIGGRTITSSAMVYAL